MDGDYILDGDPEDCPTCGYPPCVCICPPFDEEYDLTDMDQDDPEEFQE